MRPFAIGVLLLGCAACGAQSSGGDDGDDGAPAGPDAAVAHKRVFVTDATWHGDFWIESATWPASYGTDQADALCGAAAAGANLPGAWKAWISSYGSSQPVAHDADFAVDRIADVGPWYLVGTDTVVFNNKANLLNTPLVAIDVNEHGVTLDAGPVWTGTRVGGQALEDCNAWETQDDLYTGTVGDLAATGNAWTEESHQSCRETMAHLYCFEQ